MEEWTGMERQPENKIKTERFKGEKADIRGNEG